MGSGSPRAMRMQRAFFRTVQYTVFNSTDRDELIPRPPVSIRNVRARGEMASERLIGARGSFCRTCRTRSRPAFVRTSSSRASFATVRFRRRIGWKSKTDNRDGTRPFAVHAVHLKHGGHEKPTGPFIGPGSASPRFSPSKRFAKRLPLKPRYKHT